MRTRLGGVEPEVYFRIINAATNSRHGAPTAGCREQTVEIALGPKGVFENVTIGAVTRELATGGVMKLARVRRGKPNPRKEPGPPRVTELLRKAIEWRRQLDAGEVRNQAHIAHREGITPRRVMGCADSYFGGGGNRA